MNGRPLMRSAAHAACQHTPARRHARFGSVRLGAADSVRIGLLALLASVPVGPVFLSTLHRHPPHHRACVLSRCCCTGPTRLQVCLLAPPPAGAHGGCALSTRRGARPASQDRLNTNRGPGEHHDQGPNLWLGEGSLLERGYCAIVHWIDVQS